MRRGTSTPASFSPARFVLNLTNVLLALSAMGAVAALVLEYGFRTPPVPRRALHAAETIIVAVFITDRLLRFLLSRRPLQYLRENWIDFGLIGVAGLAMAISGQVSAPILSAGTLWVLITQGYLLLALLLRGVGLNLRFAESGVHPVWLILGSFALLCLVGSGLLMLPEAKAPGAPGVYYVDALFTATSASCVTGLTVRDAENWSTFGQGAILMLIQFGGLGIMIFGTVVAMLLGGQLSMRHEDATGEMPATEPLGRMSRTVSFIIAVTLIAEFIGAVLLYPMFVSAANGPGTSIAPGTAAWRSAFHAISSFCNAGFSLFNDNLMFGVTGGWTKPLRDYWQIYGVLASLIVVGGLGFPVLEDVGTWMWYRFGPPRIARLLHRQHERPRPSLIHLTLHSKLVLTTTISLIVLGTIGLFLLETFSSDVSVVEKNPTAHQGISQHRDWPTDSPFRRLRDAFFQAISARTAGYKTVDPANFSEAGKAWMCGLMIIGGSPASTAGGMKTITFAVLVLTIYSTLRKRNGLEVFHRSISTELLKTTAAIAMLYVMLVTVVALLVSTAMPGRAFINVFFESCSACGSAGLTAGLTPHLNTFSKCVVIAAMFLGRVGPIALLAAMTVRIRHTSYEYPDDSVLVG